MSLFLAYSYSTGFSKAEEDLINKEVKKNKKEFLCLLASGRQRLKRLNKNHLKIAMVAVLLVAAGSSPANAIEPGVALNAAREAAKTKAFKETARTAACISCGYCAKGAATSAQCGNAAAAAAFSCGMICMTCVYATLSLIPE